MTAAGRLSFEVLVDVACPRCRTERGPVLAVVAEAIQQGRCAECWDAWAEELASSPRARALRTGLRVVGQPAASSSSTCDQVEEQEVAAGGARDQSSIPVSLTTFEDWKTRHDQERGVMDQQTEDRVLELLVEHTNAADIARQTGATRPEILAVRDQARDDGVDCGCGKELGHRGACRGASSPAPDPTTAGPTAPGGGTAQELFALLDAKEAELREQAAHVARQLEAVEQARESVTRLVDLGAA